MLDKTKPTPTGKTKTKVKSTTKMKPTNLRGALAWLPRGAQIVALVPKGKRPLNSGGSREPMTSKEEVEAFFAEHPDSNYGIITGARSGFIVIDVDGPEGKNTIAELRKKGMKLPKTVTVKTANGYHLYYRHDGARISNSVRKLGPGVDIRGEGGYVVGPGSTHASGKPYRYAIGRAPASVGIATLPSWVEKALTAPGPKSVDGASSVEVAAEAATPAGSIAPVVAEGSRNQHLTQLAGHLRNTPLSSEGMRQTLLAENERVCSPPLSESEVTTIATSVGRYVPKTAGGDEAEDITRSVLDSRFAGGSHLVYASDGQFWVFQGTHWVPFPRKAMEGIALGVIQAMPARRGQRTVTLMEQVVKLLSATTAANGDILRFNETPPPVVNCRNGELWIKPDGTAELRPHSPESYLRHCLNVDYDPNARCPQYDAAMGEIFSKAPDAVSMVSFWNELVGYAIQPDRRIAVIVIAKGGGSNGKTKAFETLVRLVGQDLVAAMPVQDLDSSRFTIGGLLGKLIFLDDDVKAGTKLPDGQLKRLSEAKTVTGEHKYGQPFTFTVRTLPIMLCNNPPSLADLSKGMSRRLVVLPFDRTFKESEINHDLFPTIWEAEMSGVLNRAIEGLGRLVARGWRFERPQSVIAAANAWLIEANPVPAFIDECCEVAEPNVGTWLAELYQSYLAWASASGITRPQQQSTFKRNLESRGFTIVHGNKGDKVKGLRRKPR